MLEVGTVLDGYCNGYFGRNYGRKTVVGLGDNWLVARDEDAGLMLAEFDSHEEMMAHVEQWIEGKTYYVS